MENINYYILARAIHVMGVVVWIGGVVFVTTVVVPSLKRMTDRGSRFEIFEGKFTFQARVITLMTGLSGYYM